jgi:hypothetical protein
MAKGAAMMRTVLFILMSMVMWSCSAKGSPPVARLDIRVTDQDQPRVFDVVKEFGSREGFKVLSGDDLPKQGRFVSQVTIERSDGVVVHVDNFMRADTLWMFFYAEKPEGDWKSVKAALERKIAAVLNGRGTIVDVPIDSLAKPL